MTLVRHSGLAIQYLMAVATKDGAELCREHVHQVLQPGVLPQIFDVDLGPRLAHCLALDALLCWLVSPDKANIRFAAPYSTLKSCPQQSVSTLTCC